VLKEFTRIGALTVCNGNHGPINNGASGRCVVIEIKKGVFFLVNEVVLIS